MIQLELPPSQQGHLSSLMARQELRTRRSHTALIPSRKPSILLDVVYKVDVNSPKTSGAPLFWWNECPNAITLDKKQGYTKLCLWLPSIFDLWALYNVFGYLVLDGKAFILWFPTVAAFLLKDHADIHKLLTRPDACNASKHGHAACANDIIDDAEHNMMSILFVLPSECTLKLNSDEKPIKDQKMKVNMLEVHIKDTMCGPPKKPIKKDQTFSPGYFDFHCLGT
jgi:hypothetical protein